MRGDQWIIWKIERKDQYFYFLYGGHDVMRVFSKRKFCCVVVPSRPQVQTLVSLHTPPPYSFSLQGRLSFPYPTIFHATGRSRRLSPTHLEIHSLYLSITTWKSPCVEVHLGSAKLFQIIRSVPRPSAPIYEAMYLMTGCSIVRLRRHPGVH